MTKRKEQLCPACRFKLDSENRTRQEVNGVEVFLCKVCAEAAQKGKEAFRQRIETAQDIRRAIRENNKKEKKERKKAEPPDDFERQIYEMLEDIRKAEEFFKQIR